MKFAHPRCKNLLNSRVTDKKKKEESKEVKTIEPRKATGEKHKKKFTGSYTEITLTYLVACFEMNESIEQRRDCFK